MNRFGWKSHVHFRTACIRWRAQLVLWWDIRATSLPHSLEYLVLDLQASSVNMQTLATVRRARPSLKLIVIGPEGDDELVLEAIIAGRGLAGDDGESEVVRMAIEWLQADHLAPRRLLSKLIDRCSRFQIRDLRSNLT